MIKRKKARSRKPFIVTALLLLIVLIAVFLFLYKHQQDTKKSNAKTTSASKTAQSNYSSGAKRDVSTDNSASQGGAIDQNGNAATPNPNSSSWTTSPSGVITLKNPVSNSLLISGDELSGTATVNTVQYRLVDDTSGVIAQGALNVVNGQFAGKLQFNAHSTSGTLKVFSYDTQTGAETNRFQITVKLKP